jgi:pseudouridine-5'-phosphate glycosidase
MYLRLYSIQNTLAANHAVDLQSGIVIGVPIAKEDAMDDALVGEAINVAVKESMYVFFHEAEQG